VFLGDAELIVDQLGDVEPWATIREALEDSNTAWRASHPGFRTALDRGTWKPQKHRRARRRWVVQ
jgi:hypothetical protein